MNSKELDILEKAFSAQINSAFDNGFGIIQTKSKLAKELEVQGFLREVQIKLPGKFPVTVTGFALTELGNLAYCTSDRCKEE